MRVTVQTDADTKAIDNVIATQRVHDVVMQAFGCESRALQRVTMGNVDILSDETFEEHGIEVRCCAMMMPYDKFTVVCRTGW